MSSDREAFFDRFNTTTEEFISQLRNTFPNVSTFSQFQTGFYVVKTFSKYQPQTIFNTYVAIPYKSQIVANDEQFFLNEKYNIQSDSQDYWQSFIDTLRQLWKQLTPQNKEVIWKYFVVLIALNDKCMGM